MYSVVMMMALSGGADLPALGRRHGGGCDGCQGSSACSGYGCSGSGCEGGRHSGRRSRRHHSDCCGSYAAPSCCGSHGGYSSGCYGGGYMMGGCSGGYMMGGCSGGMHMEGHQMEGHQMEGHGRDKPPVKEKERKDGDKDEASLASPATLVVSLPADAKLMIDDYATMSTSGVRTFSSPVLPAGREFVYSLKAVVVQDGRSVSTTRDVTVRAGETVNVALALSNESMARK